MTLRVVLMLFVMLLAGCRTVQTVDHEKWSALPGTVEAGDRVEVTTRDGRVQTFVVTEVAPDALVGAGVRIPREDISQLRVHAVHKGRTFGAAFGGAGLALLLVLGAAFASVIGGGG